LATGILALTALALDSIGTADLSEASLPPPTDPSWKIVGAPAFGSSDSLADPRPESGEGTAVQAPAHDLVCHNRIHVVPRRRDLGAVISEQEIEVEVWNANLRAAKTLEDITVEGPAGIEVVDHLGLPSHYPASHSETYVVQVSAEGDPQVDNLVAWVFTGVEEDADLTVLGFRLIPYPFRPNMVQSIQERIGYLTDIIEAFNGLEQRRQLRAVPHGSISYTILLTSRRDAQMAAAILFGNQARTFGVGRWQFQTPLTTQATADDTEVYCDTAHIPFQVGGLVMLWRDPYRWEVQTIAAVEADHLVLTTGVRSTWPGDVTMALPVVIGRLASGQPHTHETLGEASQSLVFTIDGFTP